MKEFTDEQIIKALECCIAQENCEEISCENCPCDRVYNCKETMLQNALEVFNRQASENERLALELDISKALHKEAVAERNFYCHQMIRFESMFKTAKSEAIKEFAERLKEKLQWDVEFDNKLVFESDIDNLVKEMTEGQK